MNPGILIVDDSLTVRMSLAEGLEAANLPTRLCSTLAEAREILAHEQFGLIILDVRLPDGDGVDLLREIRETPQSSGLAVMLLSTETEVRDRIRGLKTGAQEYVGKPYEISYVVARARELLRRGRASPDQGRETILVIDDSPTFRARMKEALEAASYEVLLANTGEEGLRIAADARPSAAIVDGELPGIHGGAVIQRLRMDVALRRMPCILLTASEEQGAEIRALDAGADAFVRKDEDIAVILARLAAVLRSVDGPRADDGGASLRGPKKILAIDDSETYLQHLVGELRMEGYEVILARSGEEALDLLSAQPVDCILLDLVMPGIGGQETCQRIKSTPSLRSIPVIMLTALEERDAMIQGLSRGADDYITKSSDFEVLRARVLAQIRRKHFEDENRLVRDQLVQKELEAVEARAAREVGEMQAVMAERKRAEEEMKGLQAELAHVSRLNTMGMIASALAHEINQPLTAVKAYIGAARRKIDSVDAEQAMPVRELMAKAATQATQAAAIVRNLRDFIDKRKTSRGFEDVKTVVEEAIELGLVSGQRQNLKLNMQIDPGLRPAFINKIEIQQVLINLFRNSMEAMQGEERCELTISAVPDEADFIRVSVADTGPGIAPEVLQRLFQPFTTTKQSGMGIGLKICQSIIEAHGGRIWVTPSVSGGAAFNFLLPHADVGGNRSGGPEA